MTFPAVEVSFNKSTVWNSTFCQIVRWLVFVSLGVVLMRLVLALPPLAVAWMNGHQPDGYFLKIIRKLIAEVVSIPILLIFFGSLLFSCRRIAPHPQIAAVVFGLFLCLFQGYSAFCNFSSAQYVLALSQIAYFVIVMAGVLYIYKNA